jgi:hypothetical protein
MKRFPTRPSQRDVRNTLEWLSGGTEMEAPTRKSGPQPEGDTNKAIAKWRALKPGLVLERNKRRLATPVGYHQPIMLGWDLPGSADWIGYRSLTITADMVGKKLAQFVAIEAKRPTGGVVSADQKTFLQAVIDAGGCAGVARNAEDAEEIYGR